MTSPRDVPSPIDLRRADHATEWAAEAMVKRPHRQRFFAAIASALHAAGARRVLELGSGPGFLAQHLLAAMPDLSLTLLDFSAAMHDLARGRLGALSEEVTFVQANFLDPAWSEGLGRFDAVITMQAVHELRHKSRAITLHAAVLGLLGDEGEYLVCDHYVGPDGMTNNELFTNAAEQHAALMSAGFGRVERVLMDRGLVLHRARTGPAARASLEGAKDRL